MGQPRPAVSRHSELAGDDGAISGAHAEHDAHVSRRRAALGRALHVERVPRLGGAPSGRPPPHGGDAPGRREPGRPAGSFGTRTAARPRSRPCASNTSRPGPRWGAAGSKRMPSSGPCRGVGARRSQRGLPELHGVGAFQFGGTGPQGRTFAGRGLDFPIGGPIKRRPIRLSPPPLDSGLRLSRLPYPANRANRRFRRFRRIEHYRPPSRVGGS